MAGLDEVAILSEVAPDWIEGEQAVGGWQQTIRVARKGRPQGPCIQRFEQSAKSNVEGDRRSPSHTGYRRSLSFASVAAERYALSAYTSADVLALFRSPSNLRLSCTLASVTW